MILWSQTSCSYNLLSSRTRRKCWGGKPGAHAGKQKHISISLSCYWSTLVIFVIVVSDTSSSLVEPNNLSIRMYIKGANQCVGRLIQTGWWSQWGKMQQHSDSMETWVATPFMFLGFKLAVGPMTARLRSHIHTFTHSLAVAERRGADLQLEGLNKGKRC